MAVRVLIVALALLGASCATYETARAGTLPAAWRRVRDDGASVAFHHVSGGTIVSAISCGDADDVPLDVLTNHLLLGIEQRHDRAREPLVLDGRAALRTQLDARLDGVPVKLELVVMKKDGCTVDLYLVAPRPAFDERRVDFERFVRGPVSVSRR